MSSTLVVASKQIPFPYAAITIASFTGKATVQFDDTAKETELTLNGSTITDEEQIVQALAKEGGLSDDSAKVCFGLWSQN